MTSKFIVTLSAIILFLAATPAVVSAQGTSAYTGRGQPYGMAYDGSGNLWIADYGHTTLLSAPWGLLGWESGTSVVEVRVSDGATLGTFTVGNAPYGVVFDGANVWVSNNADNTVTKLQASTGSVLGTYTVGRGPGGIAFDGTDIWVVNNRDDTVTELVASTGATVGTFSVGHGPLALAFDGTHIWVTNINQGAGNTVTELNVSTGAIVGTFSVGHDPESAAFDGTAIWVANYADGTVSKLQASSGTVLGTFAVGGSPISVMFDGASIWVSINNAGSAALVNLRASDGTILATDSLSASYQCTPYPAGCTLTGAGNTPVCQTPPPSTVSSAGLAFDSVHTWVANPDGCSVTKF